MNWSALLLSLQVTLVATIILFVIGLLLGFVGLLWLAVIAIITDDRHINRRNLRDPHGAVVGQLSDDKKAA